MGCEVRLVSQVCDNPPGSITRIRSGILFCMAVRIRVLRRGAELGGTGAIILGTHEGTEGQRGPDLASSRSMLVADSCRVSVRGEDDAAQKVSVRLPTASCPGLGPPLCSLADLD